MLFSYRAFTHAKDPEHQDQDQDAYGVSEKTGVAVIADGVSSAIFSAAWAQILTRSALEDFPGRNPDAMPAFLEWLQKRRKEWSADIHTENLAWFQKPKLATGAFSTLLWMKLEPCGFPGDDWPGEKDALDPEKPCFWLSATAIGDSCLFHIRAGRPDFGRYDGTDLVHVFPMENSADFEASPAVLGSVDLGRDSMLAFQQLGIIVQEGDFIVLATDALSLWALRGYEAGYSPGWENFWAMPEPQWRAMIDTHRQQGNMRYDDATLLMLQIGQSQKTQPHPTEETTAAETDEVWDEAAETYAEDDADVEAEERKDAEAPEDVPKVVIPLAPRKPVAQTPPRVQPPHPAMKTPPQEKSPPPQAPADAAPEAPARPAFRYSLAGDKNKPAEQPEQARDFSEEAARQRQQEESTWADRSAEIGSRFDTLREKGAQVAENLGEKISDGMNTLGEATHQFVDAAKPRIQRAFQGVMGFFRKDKTSDAPREPDEDELRRQNEEKARQRAAERKADPNRRRFYKPKNENDSDQNHDKKE